MGRVNKTWNAYTRIAPNIFPTIRFPYSNFFNNNNNRAKVQFFTKVNFSMTNLIIIICMCRHLDALTVDFGHIHFHRVGLLHLVLGLLVVLFL
jgi:hypothetical protein